MSSNCFLVASLGFSMYSIMSSANSNSFTSFPIWISFLSFSPLISMARSSKTTLNNSSESGHLCLVPDLSTNAFRFSPLSMMLAVGLSYMAFIMLRLSSLYNHFLESFYYKWVVNFVRDFSAPIEMTRWFLFFSLLM
uniref:Uncharacterized protein n=1 Tax=Sus scrofa TaxID=9823 RepID=A0A8D1L8F0_PIG